MTYALRYMALGFITALALQLWQDPPAWALLIAYVTGMLTGVVFTALQMWVVDQLEKRDL